MTCPRCQARLSLSVRDGIEIDRCPRCRGVWLDAGELDRLLAKAWAAFELDQDADEDDRDDELAPAGAVEDRRSVA